MTRPVRRALAALTALGTATLAMLATAPAASAHDELLSSKPADGQVATEVPAAVELTFSADLILTGVEIVVTNSGGKQVPTGSVGVSGSEVTTPLPSDLASGDYDVTWRVVSSDGHPIDGSFSFTLDVPDPSPSPSDTKAAAPAPSATPSAEQAPEPASTALAVDQPSTDDGQVSSTVLWWFAGIIAVLLLAIAAIWLIEKRRKAQRNDPAGT
ncbi:copper resistance CopC family protein [Isoptericola cucumis]|uniref:copper resistance CopC family protein n=1 Tax=Isoptericola cucumis TaxID=1776856 RepID=UPI00166CFF6E|nr:copper resistance protein CopC [Isoptericola cucumis]